MLARQELKEKFKKIFSKDQAGVENFMFCYKENFGHEITEQERKDILSLFNKEEADNLENVKKYARKVCAILGADEKKYSHSFRGKKPLLKVAVDEALRRKELLDSGKKLPKKVKRTINLSKSGLTVDKSSKDNWILIINEKEITLDMSLSFEEKEFIRFSDKLKITIEADKEGD